MQCLNSKHICQAPSHKNTGLLQSAEQVLLCSCVPAGFVGKRGMCIKYKYIYSIANWSCCLDLFVVVKVCILLWCPQCCFSYPGWCCVSEKPEWLNLLCYFFNRTWLIQPEKSGIFCCLQLEKAALKSGQLKQVSYILCPGRSAGSGLLGKKRIWTDFSAVLKHDINVLRTRMASEIVFEGREE